MKSGKFERIDAKPKKKANAGLLQTYIISILSLVLCCAMFLSTTFAWFTSDVTSSGNQIHIGTLEATLWHKTVGETYTQITSQNNEHVFSGDKIWEPGVSTEETLKIENSGEIAFRYSLQLLISPQNTMTQEQLMAAAEWFEVSYRAIGDAEWTDVIASNGEKATLAQVLQEGIPVFQGELVAETQVEYALRLYMKTEAELAQIQGQTLLIDVRLVASQLAQEYPGYQEKTIPAGTDLTGYSFEDNTVYQLEAGEYAAGGLLISADNVVIKGVGDQTKLNTGEASLYGQAAVFVEGDNVTIRDLMVESTATERISAVKVSDGQDPSGIVRNFTMENVTLSSVSGSGLNLHGVEGAQITNVRLAQYATVGISLAQAVNIRVSGCKFASGGWAAIGCMYGESDLYKIPCSLKVDETSTFGNSYIYSERPGSALNGRDTITCPWTVTMNEKGWLVTVSADDTE